MAGSPAAEPQELPAYQAARRQRIVDAAKELLRTSDYESIQIRDVAAAANVALGTLYRYFSSKEHLYANVVYEWAKPFSAEPTPNAENLDTAGRIGARLRGALTAYQKHPYFYRATLQLRSSSDPEAMLVMAQLGTVLEEPMRAEMHALDDQEATDITVMVWAVLLDVVSRVQLTNMSVADADRVLERFVDLIRHRVTTVHG